MSDRREKVVKLLENLKNDLPDLKELLERTTGHWGLEDSFYRLYHHSFKVYSLQSLTQDIADRLRSYSEDGSLNQMFEKILSEGTGKPFEYEHNQRWMEETRPIVEAFFHAKHFLEMAIKYAEELEEPPSCLPSGWASVLYLYRMR